VVNPDIAVYFMFDMFPALHNYVSSLHVCTVYLLIKHQTLKAVGKLVLMEHGGVELWYACDIVLPAHLKIHGHLPRELCYTTVRKIELSLKNQTRFIFADTCGCEDTEHLEER